MNSIAILDSVVSGKPLVRSVSRPGSPTRTTPRDSASSSPAHSPAHGPIPLQHVANGTGAGVDAMGRPTRGRLLRTPTPMPTPTLDKRQGRDRASTRLRKRRRRPRPPLPGGDKGWLGGAFVAVMSLWAGLWTVVFGPDGQKHPSRRSLRPLEEKSELTEKAPAVEGDPSDTEAADSAASDGEGWVDPVTRAPEDPLEQLEGVSDIPPPRTRSPSPSVTLQLRSGAQADNGTANGSTPPRGSSILTNPTQQLPTLPQTRLLPNPLSPTLLTDHGRKPSLSRNPSSDSTTASTPGHARMPSIIRGPTPFHRPKTLILDLDETLIHSTSRPMSVQSSGMGGGSGLVGISLAGFFPGSGRRGGGGARGEGHTVEVVLGGRSTLYHVYKRPFVDHFLKKVASWYTLVIFTASMQEYADPVIDWLDGGRGLFGKKLYRESCSLQPNGSYIKDLSLVDEDLSTVCFVDNSPVSYNWNKANALPIEGWTSDPNDEALLDLLPVLDSLRFTSDVRRVLGIRGF